MTRKQRTQRTPPPEPFPQSIMVWGQRYWARGVGAYPYDCIARDNHPHAMIYTNTPDGPGAWITSEDALYRERDRQHDVYENTEQGGCHDPETA